MTAPVRAPRTRNAEASRRGLLDSARTLFSERGFDQTTVRDIGDHAGVDPALIARYFGNKGNLYLATVVAEDTDTARPEITDDPRAYVEWLVARVDVNGPGPILQALVRFDTTPEIRQAARDHLTRRVVEPLASVFESRGVSQPRVRAEIVMSALIGVVLSRTLGSFDAMGQLDRTALIDLLVEMLPELRG